MAETKEYIEAIFRAAKGHLPSWVWKHLHKLAFPSSGGVARHRVDKQDMPMTQAGMTVSELFTQRTVRGEPYSKAEATYLEPTSDALVACGACRFYLRHPHEERGLCQLVLGEIAWFGTCSFFISAAEEAAFALSTVEKQGFEVQTVVFPKEKWTLARARAWLTEHDFKTDKVDETANSYRFRQQEPGQFQRIRPVCLMPNGAAPNLEACSVLAFGGVIEKADYVCKFEKPGHFQARQSYPVMGQCEGKDCTAKALDRHHKNGNTDDNTRKNVSFLCRQCHMLADGRTHFDSGKAAGMSQLDIDEEIDKATGDYQDPDKRRKRRRRQKELEKEIPIMKIDEEKMVVYGVVLDPYIIDTQGDWSPPSEVEKTAHEWMENSRTIGLRHRSELQAAPVESFLMPYPSTDDYKLAMANEPHQVFKFKFGEGFVHSGSWVLATKVHDESTWQLVKSGELGSYSIGGQGERTVISEVLMPRITKTIEVDWSKAA